MSVSWCRKSFLPLFLLLGLAAGSTAGLLGKNKASASQSLPERINAVARQLPGVSLDDSEPLTSQIQQLVIGHMTEWLAARTPTDVDARREIDSLFTLLRYPVVATAATFAQPWNGRIVMAAGYNLGWSDYDRENVIAIYTGNPGPYRLAAVTNSGLPHADLNYQPLSQIAWQDLRFFAYGHRLGKSQQRLSVVLYSFDGTRIKPLWERADIFGGEMAIAGDKVTLRYLIEDEYVQAVERKSTPPRHLATYQLTAAGIQIVDDHEIPY